MNAGASSRHRPYVAAGIAWGIAVLLLGSAGAHAGTTGLPHGRQVNDDPAAGIDPTQSVSDHDPANADVAAGTLSAGAAAVPWAVFEQTSSGGNSDQVFVRSFAHGVWTTRGRGTVGGRSSGVTPAFRASLNFDQARDGESPSIDFAGADRRTPWVTWYEDTTGAGFGADNIFASRYDAKTAKWVFAGQGRGEGGGTVQVPSLNIHSDDDAEDPALAGGTTTAGGTAGPWITWQESDGGSDQIFVVRPVGPNATSCVGRTPAGGAPVGGFCWQQVGAGRVNSADPSLNVDRSRNAIQPDIAFAGRHDTVPWVVWYEIDASATPGLASNGQVFAAKAVRDASSGGGFHWQVVGNGTAGKAYPLDDSASGGPCTAGAPPLNGSAEAACALNKHASDSAAQPRVAAGTMARGKPTVPWVAWSETVGSTSEIFVARLVAGGRFELANGGKPVSSSADPSVRPDITFAGHTPYVSWLSDTRGGVEAEFLGHFVNAASPRFVADDGPLRVVRAASADVRAPVSSACTDTPSSSDGAHCQGGALGTPFSLRTAGSPTLELLASAYRPGKPVTRAARHIATTSATARGAVNPAGATVEVRFQYGATRKYGRHTAYHRIGPATARRAVSARLRGLGAHKQVHYRLEVRTDFGLSYSADRAFRTHARH